MKNKIIWKDVTLIVLAILLIFLCAEYIHSNSRTKNCTQQNLELNHQLATLKEKKCRFRIKAEQRRKYTQMKKKYR